MLKRKLIKDIKLSDEILSKSEPYTCSHFGCGRQLTLHESLCGNKCTTHQRPHIITIRNFNNKKKSIS